MVDRDPGRQTTSAKWSRITPDHSLWIFGFLSLKARSYRISDRSFCLLPAAREEGGGGALGAGRLSLPVLCKTCFLTLLGE